MSDKEPRDTGTFQGTSSSTDVPGEGTMRGTFLSDDSRWAKLRDRLFTALALAAIIALALTSYYTIKTNQAVAELNASQVEVVKAQNDTQLCAQHDIVLAVRSIGEKLGLPVDDITVPDVKGLNCP